jgi:ribosomal subunit interface protein
MIKRLEISGVHMDLEDDLKKYVTKKLGKLDHYIPRHARDSAHADVKLKESHAKNKRQFTCEIKMSLPGEQIMVSESTLNIFAAVDIAEETLKNRLKKYKEKRVSERSGHKDRKVRKLFGKILSR